GGCRTAAITEERLLTGGFVRCQPGSGRAAGRTDIRGPNAEAKAGERRVAGKEERTKEYTSGDIPLAVAAEVGRRIVVAAGTICDAVEDAERVVDPSSGEVSAKLYADVAVGHEVRRQRPLDEAVVGGGLQPLEAHGRLELAHRQHQPGLESRRDE